MRGTVMKSTVVKDTVRRPLLTAGLPCFAVSGGARADHQAPNLEAFKILCLSGIYQKQDEENEAVLATLPGRMADALDGAGIRVDDGCKLADAVRGHTQLNLYHSLHHHNLYHHSRHHRQRRPGSLAGHPRPLQRRHPLARLVFWFHWGGSRGHPGRRQSGRVAERLYSGLGQRGLRAVSREQDPPKTQQRNPRLCAVKLCT